MDQSKSTLYLGAGCFWNAEKSYNSQNGVLETEVGWSTYIPRNKSKPGRVEVVKIEFDTTQTSVERLVDVFWDTHDTSHRRNDDPYYVERSMLFATSEESLDELQGLLAKKKSTDDSIKTAVALMESYIRAPEKDQKYYLKN